jgi:hypothetical protein
MDAARLREGGAFPVAVQRWGTRIETGLASKPAPAFGRIVTNGMLLDGVSGLFKGRVAIAEDGMQLGL